MRTATARLRLDEETGSLVRCVHVPRDFFVNKVRVYGNWICGDVLVVGYCCGC